MKSTVRPNPKRRLRRVSRPYTIHHIFEEMPGDIPVDKCREQLRRILNDDALWDLLREAEALMKKRQTISNKLDRALKAARLK